MFIKKLIFVLFSVTAIQASSEIEDPPGEAEEIKHSQTPCMQELTGFTDKISSVRQKYDEFYKKLTEKGLEGNFAQRSGEIHYQADDILKKAYEYHNEAVVHIPFINDLATQKKLCVKYVLGSVGKLEKLVKPIDDFYDAIVEAKSTVIKDLFKEDQLAVMVLQAIFL